MINGLSNKIPNILIVDDVPANLKILSEILKAEGYKVRPVPNGSLALQVAEKEKPDLILLDIMMPEMDGFEVCHRLKADKNLKEIPVIFISALNDTKDIVKALQIGGVDYITKPFQSEEVIVRVNTHFKLYQQSLLLQEQSKELQDLNATKDKFFSIIAHDLRGPLGGFMQLTELLADDTLKLSAEDEQHMMLDLNQSARNIYNLLVNLLEWSKMQRGRTSFKPRTTELKELVTGCEKLLEELARKKSIEIIIDISSEQTVFADINMLQAVVRNLISNAIKFTSKGGSITVSANTREDNSVLISVKDTGIGMNSKILDNLFHLDVNCSRLGTEGESSTGLGLILCKEFVEKHGGEIWAESEEGKCSVFYFTMPADNG